MGRLYNVKGWLEPAEETGESLISIVEAVATSPEYRGLMNNWSLTRAFGYSEFVFFGATAKYADCLVEDVVNRIISSDIQVDGYFECIDEEDENSWCMRIIDSEITKTDLPFER